MLKYRSMI